MTARPTLTEELQRTLRDRSLDAPEPAHSIDEILARTTGRPASAEAEQLDQPRGRRWLAALGSDQPRTKRLLTAAVAVAAVVVVGFGVSKLPGTGSEKGSSSAASSGTSAASGAGALSAGLAAGGSSAAAAEPQAPGPLVLPSAAASASARANTGATGSSSDSANSPFLVTPPDLSCPNGITMQQGSTVSAGLHRLILLTARCGTPDAARTGGEVVYAVSATSPPRVVATLVPASKDLHVDYVAVDGATVTVHAANWARNASGGLGAISDYRFVMSNNGTTFTALGAQLEAKACTNADVTVSVPTVINAGGSASHAVLTFVNRTAAPCAIEGAPTVSTSRNGRVVTPVAVRQNAVGEIGDPSTTVPIIELAPAATASATLSGVGTVAASGCSTIDSLTIGMPVSGVPLATVGFTGVVCSPTVGAVVSGPNG